MDEVSLKRIEELRDEMVDIFNHQTNAIERRTAMKIKTTKVIGMEELVKLFCDPKTSDSYEMHIEDPENGETAPYSFVLGDQDMFKILNRIEDTRIDHGGLSSSLTDPRGQIVVYADVENATLKYLQFMYRNCDYDCTPALTVGNGFMCKLRMSYYDIVKLKDNLLSVVKENHYVTENAHLMLNWINSLPYQELLEIKEEED